MCSDSLNAKIMAVLLAGVFLAEGRSAEAGTIIPIDQERFTNALASFAQCDKVSDGDQAEGFDPFDSTVEAAQNCNGPYAHMSATQQSQIDATSMTVSGGIFFKNTGFEQEPIALLAGADSVFEVTFELPSASTFALAGMLSTWGFGPAHAFGTGVEIVLTGPAGETIFAHSVSVPKGEGGAAEKLIEAGALQPGVYTLRADAGAGIDGMMSSSGVGDASFNFTIEFLVICPVDLDGDGGVGPADLALLLGNWGPVDCAGAGCPDFDGDGDVDAADLAVLLGNWGACEG